MVLESHLFVQSFCYNIDEKNNQFLVQTTVYVVCCSPHICVGFSGGLQSPPTPQGCAWEVNRHVHIVPGMGVR